MHFPSFSSLSERCFSGFSPYFDAPSFEGGKIECRSRREKIGATLSYLPTQSFHVMGRLAKGLNAQLNAIKQGPNVAQTDAVGQAAIKRLSYLGRLPLVALGSVVYLGIGALSFALSILDLVGVLLRCAAMGEAYDMIEGSIVIQKDMETVWEYASNSLEATNWSVYFHHITPTQAFDTDGTLISDGQMGATRRCYRRADETGIYWDEVITELKKKHDVCHRQIHTYNLQGFHIPLASQTRYVVNQVCVKQPDGTVTMVFDTYIQPPKGLLGRLTAPLTKMGFLLQRKEVKRIFDLNLANIRAAIEQGKSYVRPHPYEA